MIFFSPFHSEFFFRFFLTFFLKTFHWFFQHSSDFSTFISPDFLIHSFLLQDISQITLETRFGCLDPNISPDSDARKLIKAAHLVIEAVMNTEVGQTDAWRYFPTRMYRQLCTNEDLMAGIVSKVLKEKLDGILSKNVENFGSKSGVINQFFSDPKTTFGDVLATVLDLMLAGIDTTAFSSGFVLYYLARNQNAQEKLRREIFSALASSSFESSASSSFESSASPSFESPSSASPSSADAVNDSSVDRNLLAANLPEGKNNSLKDNSPKNNSQKNNSRIRAKQVRNVKISPDILNKMPYMKAVVKETMRLAPLSIGIGRVTTQPTVIRDYLIPPDTMVITQNQVACRLDTYFYRPDDFIPERWMNLRTNRQSIKNGQTVERQSSESIKSIEDEKALSGKKNSDINPDENNPQVNPKRCPSENIFNEQNINHENFIRPHPFLALPFGYGPRSCPGRRISDMNTYVLLIKLLTNFRIEYHGEDIGMVTRLINIPDKPMQFRFIDIE